MPFPSRRRPRRDTADDPEGDRSDERRAASGINPAILITAVAGGVLLLASGGAVLWLAMRPAAAPPSPSSIPAAAITPQPINNTPGPAVHAPPAGEQPPEAQLSVEAPALLSGYLRSNVGATQEYTGKILDVRGVVLTTRRDRTNNVLVDLNGAEVRGLCVRCAMLPAYAEKAGALKRGQAVTIRGRCDGKGPIIDVVDQSANVVVRDCHLIEVRADAPAPPPRSTVPEWIEPPATATHGFMSIGVAAVEAKRVELIRPTGFKALGAGHLLPTGGETVGWSRDVYVQVRLTLHNVGGGEFMYEHPALTSTKLTDEHGNAFAICKDVGMRREIAVPPGATWGKEELYIKGQWAAAQVQAGEVKGDLLLFTAERLGKGKQLLLELPGSVFANHLPGQAGLAKVPDKVRFKLAQPEVVAFKAPEIDPDKLRKVGTPQLTQRLRGKEAAVRYEAAHGLAARATELAGTMEGHITAIRLAKMAQQEPEEEVRAAVVYALGELGGAVRKVLAAKGKAAAGARGQASLIYQSVRPALVAAKADPSPKVAEAAKQGLAKLGL